MIEAHAYVPQFPRHSPLYLIEAGGLGAFMPVAALVDTALESHRFHLHALVASALRRRALMGAAMGGTVEALIYSRRGARSGAHLNPAPTLTYALLGKTGRFDAALFACAQFADGAAGVLLAHQIAGPALAQAPVSCAVTVRGSCGVGAALGMEVLISAMLMVASLYASNRGRLMR